MHTFSLSRVVGFAILAALAATNAAAQEPVATTYSVRTATGVAVNVPYATVIVPGDGQNTVDVLILPVHGTVNYPTVISGSGQAFAYTPTAGYSGLDEFLYRVEDGSGDVSFAYIRVNVGNVAATASDDDLVVPALPDSFLDILSNDEGFADPVTFSITQQPAHGTLTLVVPSPAWQSLIGVYYTPAPGYTGPDQFQYQLGDSIDTDGATVTLTVSPDTDLDDILDYFDNCPANFNPGQEDGDGDGAGDACDNCLATANPNQANSDSDVHGNMCDNCRLISNPTQLDANGDGFGNICDADLNNTGLVTATDFSLLRSVLNQPASASPTAAAADLNGSGLVTSADFGLLRSRLNTAPGPGAGP